MWWQKWLSQKWKGIWLTGELLIEGTSYVGMKKEKKKLKYFFQIKIELVESFFIRQTLQNFEFFKVKKQILGEVKMQNYR